MNDLPVMASTSHEFLIKGCHDPLAFRLSHIVIRLFMGDKLSLSELARDFKVSNRTIYRDLHERLSMLDIECINKTYFLSKRQFGARLTSSDLIRFAKMTYVDRLLPALDNKLATILTMHHISPFIIYAYPPKTDVPPFGAFLLITESILSKQCLLFDVNKGKHDFSDYLNSKLLPKVEALEKLTQSTPFKPYRLVYVSQEWFLVGCYLEKISVYRYDSLMNVKKLTDTFKVNEQLFSIIESEQFIQSLPHYELLSIVLNIKLS